LNDAEFEAQKVRIVPLLDKWANRLLESGWRLSYTYHRGLIPDVDGTGVRENRMMSVGTRWEYLKAHIHVDLEKVAECDDEYLNIAAAHEIAHIAVNELRHTTDDWVMHEERVCTRLALAFTDLESENGSGAEPDCRGVQGADTPAVGADPA